MIGIIALAEMMTKHPSKVISILLILAILGLLTTIAGSLAYIIYWLNT